MTRRTSPTTLASRLALRAPEAAAALGISERKLREISRLLPTVRLDGVLLYPVDALRRWLDEEAKKQQVQAEQTADSILRELNEGGGR